MAESRPISLSSLGFGSNSGGGGANSITEADSERRGSQSSMFSMMSSRTSMTTISNRPTSLTSGHRSSIDQQATTTTVAYGKGATTTMTANSPPSSTAKTLNSNNSSTTTSTTSRNTKKHATLTLTSLPPDVTVRILHHLPVPTLSIMAQVSRRFKVLVNNEEIYIRKLKQMALWQDLDRAAQSKGGLLDAPVAPVYVGSDLRTYQQKNESTGHEITSETYPARAQFQRVYRELIPYYVDLRHRNREPRIQSEFPDPVERAQMIARLRRFMPVKVVNDYKTLNLALETVTQLLESRSLQQFEHAYHTDDTEAMKYHASVLFELNGGQSCVQMYIQMNQLFFDNEHAPLDNLSSSAINENGDHIPLLNFTEHLQRELERQAKMISEIFSEDDDVLFAFTERVYEDVIVDYVNELMAGALQRSLPDYLNLTVEAYRRISALTISLTQMRPRALDPERAHRCLYSVFSPLMEPYIEREVRALREMYDREIRRWDRQMAEMKHRAEVERARRLMGAAEREAYKKGFLRRLKRGLTRSKDAEIPTPNATEADDSAANIVQELSGLLSLEMSLQMIHVNKQALHRVLRFASLGGRAGVDVGRGLERIFVSLLHTLGPRHVKPAFEAAVERLSEYKTTRSTANDEQVQPILRFFELIHLGDLVHQMIFVYYKEEICRFVDEHDFTNGCNAEKKAFERNLDDVVASGLDRSIEVLMGHVEYILENEQKPTDYDPENEILDLKPTKACYDVVKCLSTHTQMVSGATEKSMLEVFYTELGLRFFNILSKHLKKIKLASRADFKLLGNDLNHYHEWAESLNAAEALRYFHALKELGHIYIVSPQDLRELMHDRRRYQGALREEEIYEFVQLRKDYRRIQKVVESENAMSYLCKLNKYN
ncbi:exocyst complex component Sec10-domain-containing protein [Syncephalis fuscata]|nr:exocyst complex component Sec10-domain-containing protein [Syncephalis fuscata]